MRAGTRLYELARDFARAFYNSDAWDNCRKAYAKSVGGLCERCLKEGRYTPGKVVHHKTHLNPGNINDPAVTLAWGNLQLLCMDCHAAVHRTQSRRYTVDQYGRVTA